MFRPRDEDGCVAGSQTATIVQPPPSRWARMSPNLQGSLLEVASFVFFAGLAVMVKMLGARLPVIEILFFRQTIILALMLPFHFGDIRGLVATAYPVQQIARGMLMTLSMVFGFTSLVYLPLADSHAIGFVEVLFMTIGAVLILKETVGWRRWAATGVGFAGVMTMLSPFGAGVTVYTLAAVIAPLFGSMTTIMVRRMAERESTSTILFWQSAVVIVALAVPTAYVWVTPTAGEGALLIGVGAFGLAGQWLYTRAYQIGEAAALAPMHFTRLLLAATAGYFLFAEVPNLATVAGAVLVIGATVYTLKRNAVGGPAPAR